MPVQLVDLLPFTHPCNLCNNEGWLCERHPEKPWEHDDCRAAGVPCRCNPTAAMPIGFEIETALPSVNNVAIDDGTPQR